MALEEFEKDQLSERDKGYLRMRSIMDYSMGLIFIGMGVFLFFIKQFNTRLAERYDDATIKVFAGICIVYGIFRIWRAFKKNYLRDR